VAEAFNGIGLRTWGRRRWFAALVWSGDAGHLLRIDQERAMMIFNPRCFALAMMVAGVPLGYAFAGGSGGGAGGAGTSGGVGGGVGAAGMGSAAVGSGAPSGSVGGGTAAGAVGGGTPGSSRPAGNGAAGTGNPALNATGARQPGVKAPEIRPTTTTTGGIIGGQGGQTTGTAPVRNVPGGASPAGASNQEGSSAAQSTPPNQMQGTANTQAQAEDVPLRPVPARPCGVAAHETDGTTTCIGIPDRPHRRR